VKGIERLKVIYDKANLNILSEEKILSIEPQVIEG
jgi:hypothetical protein